MRLKTLMLGLGAMTLAFSGCVKTVESRVTVIPSKAVIVTTGGKEKAAAEELALHLKLITGVEIPLKPKAEKGDFIFAFDPGKLADNDEACAWEVTKTKAIFRGKVQFAVLDFLENALGVRWPGGDDVSFAEMNPLVIAGLSGAWVPELKIRTIRYRADASNSAFARRMRAGSHDGPVYGHAFTGHWKKYGKDHRDYFAMRKDGIRGPSNAKPDELTGNVAVYAADTGNTLAICCTSTGLVAQIVKDWIKAGKGEYINLCENDVPGQNSCQCPACKALDVVPERVDPKWETHYADRYVYFGNTVLGAARKFRPDVKVCYYAYNATQDAPAREKPDPASIAGIVPTVFTDDYVKAYVGGWKKAGLEHFFYRPNRHHYFGCTYLPCGFEEHFFNLFKHLYSQGAIGFDYDAGSVPKHSFGWLDRYVLFHAMQDPSKSYGYWEDHYCQAYGDAAPDVKAYCRFWREEVWNKRLEPNMDVIVTKGKWFNFGRGLLWNLKDYYTAEDFLAADKFLAAAEAKPLAAPQKALLENLRIAHEHAKVFFEAVAHKSKANTEKLVAFRRAHDIPVYNWSEQYYGDITGVEGLLGKEKKGDK
ncbi:MAG TPA: DUF4838 domain-containing protein [Opitutales bacterium]|nr:DUF4838 domain-containing protein [Opitutales bacterium]